ncbi:PelD GGDEF domain-containing protein [Gammaproteobacteria bacterium]|nr:PelD GGDEF domain-containing protein [Gammaproteobacteria bacterium]
MNKINYQGYIESLVLSLIMISIGFLTNYEDPLYLQSQFPWVWFFPVLIMLRYGWFPGLIPLLFIFISMIYSIYFLNISWDSYKLWLLGGVTLSLICGEYQSSWYKKLLMNDEKIKYIDSGLQFVSRSYGVLKLSHDRLEESFVNSPTTIRQSLSEVRNILNYSNGKLTKEAAKLYLELFSLQAFMESGAIYMYQNKEWNLAPISHLGIKANDLVLEDILVKKCLERRETVYSSVNILQDEEKSLYLAVIPMITSENKIIGLLTINSIQFFMLNDSILEKLTLLLSYVADEINASKNALLIRTQYPSCPSIFANELLKLRHVYDLVKIDSCIFAMYIKPSPARKNIIDFLKNQMRGLDMYWEYDNKDNGTTIFIILFPLMTKSMYEGYITRIELMLFKDLHIKLDEGFMFLKHREISEYKDNASLLDDIIKNDKN